MGFSADFKKRREKERNREYRRREEEREGEVKHHRDLKLTADIKILSLFFREKKNDRHLLLQYQSVSFCLLPSILCLLSLLFL